MSTRRGGTRKVGRPNSAVYIGPPSPNIPDLPSPEAEPPSPSSSAGSGLPSPPATNSTGSTGSVSHKMLTEHNVKTFHAALTHDDDDDDDNEEDNTARLDRRHSLNENMQALERVKSLAHRNRIALDKLSSYSRSTPSPKPRHSFTSDGSETERESVRVRLLSAPTSPGKALAKKRVTLAADEHDVTQLALAAVASSRRSPTGKKRQPLPREFREGSSSTASTSSSGNSASRRSSITDRLQLSPNKQSSTVRRHQTRWLSEDISSQHSYDDDHPPGSRIDTGRRQSLRGGSAESALNTPGSRLASEGLRAAGLNRRSREINTSSEFFDPPEERSFSRLAGGGGGARTSSRAGGGGGTITQRIDLRNPSPEVPKTPGLRSYKSAFPLSSTSSRDPERAPSSLSRYNSPLPLDRDRERYASPRPRPPSTSGDPTTSSGIGGGGGGTEHTRLMHESLQMFTTHLSRLTTSPSLSPSTDLVKNAENLVWCAEKVNILLRNSTNRALEAQIDAEVNLSPSSSSERESDMWRRVGGECRESLRASDELVRSVTGVLIGFGRAVRDFATAAGAAGGGEQQHVRSGSFDDEERERYLTRSGSVLGGRPKSRAREDDFVSPQPKASSSSAARHSLPNGVGSMRRVYTPIGIPTADSQETLRGESEREREREREYEPSPTNNRLRAKEKDRQVPPLSIPKPLPTLPSEAKTPKRSATTSSATIGRETFSSSARRKSSVSTIRGTAGGGGTSGGTPGRMGLEPTSATPTTAVTVENASSTGVAVAFPSLLRSDSAKSATSTSGGGGGGRAGTISKSSTVSVLQHLASDRRRPRTTSVEEEGDVALPASIMKQLSSGSGSGGGSDSQRRVGRVSLGDDMAKGGTGTGRAADRSAVSTILGGPSTSGTTAAGTTTTNGTSGMRRERRRTIVDVWPSSSGGS